MAIKTGLRSELIGFENEALSLLLHFWAEPLAVKRRARQWDKKLPKFRSAVIAGMKKRSHEIHIPHELIEPEYRHIYEMLKQLREECKGEEHTEIEKGIVEECIQIPIRCDGQTYTFERPIPLMGKNVHSTLRQLLKRSKKLSEISHGVVGKRLKCGPDKVRKATAKKLPKRFTTSRNQRLLISIFLDLCSVPKKDLRLDLLALILNTLFLTKCHVLVIYYLLQNAHKMKTKLFVGEYSTEQVEELCLFLSPESQVSEFKPFIRLT